MILPRYSVLPMKEAICEKTRLETPRVAVLVAVAQEGVSLVDHHRHRRHGLEDREHSLEVRLGDALPFGPEVAELDHGHADLAREGRDEEALARADRAGDEVAHGQHVEPALLDRPRRIPKPALHELVARHEREIVFGLEEFEEACGLGFYDLLLLAAACTRARWVCLPASFRPRAY